jgi:hypothetical protein
MFGCIAQRLAELSYSVVESVLEVHKGICGPEFLAEFVARDHFTGLLEERQEDVEGVFSQPDPARAIAQFPGSSVQLEVAEADREWRAGGFFHSGASTIASSILWD